MPKARKFFLGGVIEENALKFLDMFGWLIRSLNRKDVDMFSALDDLGKKHKEMGVTSEFFKPFLSVLHATLSEHFEMKYTIAGAFARAVFFFFYFAY